MFGKELSKEMLLSIGDVSKSLDKVLDASSIVIDQLNKEGIESTIIGELALNFYRSTPSIGIVADFQVGKFTRLMVFNVLESLGFEKDGDCYFFKDINYQVRVFDRLPKREHDTSVITINHIPCRIASPSSVILSLTKEIEKYDKSYIQDEIIPFMKDNRHRIDVDWVRERCESDAELSCFNNLLINTYVS